jgi:DNA primase large subunit
MMFGLVADAQPGSPTTAFVGSGGGGGDVLSTGVVAKVRRCIEETPLLKLYRDKPGQRDVALFDLEALIMKRMELLGHIDERTNAVDSKSSQEIIGSVSTQLKNERFYGDTAAPSNKSLQSDLEEDQFDAKLNEGCAGKDASADRFCFTAADDALSHFCCRLVFCQTEQWRSWFLRYELILLRARLMNIKRKVNNDQLFYQELFAAAEIPCTPVDPRTLDDDVVAWMKRKAGSTDSVEEFKTQLYSVPLSHALSTVRRREVVCVGGRALVHFNAVIEAYYTEYRHTLQRGLRDALFTRQRLLKENDDNDDASSALGNVTTMLDAFFKRFIVDPADKVKPQAEGTVTPADIPMLAKTHFPLCMQRTDAQLRGQHHLKHNGRWMYGLFLKSVGLSMEDSVKLFGDLMTEKEKGGPEAFKKSSYAYNIRHMYGKEGKRTDYSSLSCPTIVAMPPNTDKYDCHGCPYRFKEEAPLRAALGRERPNPRGGNAPPLRISQGDIEDIVADAKGMHYTRACFKHFTAMHAGMRNQRETLFRSPFDFYNTSQLVTAENAANANVASPPVRLETGVKREGESSTVRTLFKAEKKHRTESGSPS